MNRGDQSLLGSIALGISLDTSKELRIRTHTRPLNFTFNAECIHVLSNSTLMQNAYLPAFSNQIYCKALMNHRHHGYYFH